MDRMLDDLILFTPEEWDHHLVDYIDRAEQHCLDLSYKTCEHLGKAYFCVPRQDLRRCMQAALDAGIAPTTVFEKELYALASRTV